MSGRLSVVATPIGCLEDITLRALRVLREAEVILAEDTRHTKKLCAKHDITTPLKSFHAHTDAAKLGSLLEALEGGAHFALVSDAGTPLISDPGGALVAQAVQRGVTVEPIPGPSAVLAALSVSGLPSKRFRFEGFLPKSGPERRDALDRIASADGSVVLFESPNRTDATLTDLQRVCAPERQVALCRELTKLHEETLRGTISDVCSKLPDPLRGEVTIVIEGASGTPDEEIDVNAQVQQWAAEGISSKDMVHRLQLRTGWKRNRAYQAVLDVVEPKD